MCCANLSEWSRALHTLCATPRRLELFPLIGIGPRRITHFIPHRQVRLLTILRHHIQPSLCVRVLFEEPTN